MISQFAKTSKHTLTLLIAVYAAVKRSAVKAGVEPNELIQQIIIDYVIQDGTLDEPARKHIQTGRELIAIAVKVAKRRCRDGQFAPSITLDTFVECCADPSWIADYETYVGDNPYKNGNPLKAINREIGFGIRRGIGGTVETLPGGKPVTVKVLGQVIQSYTPMSAFDPAAVA